MHGSKRSRSPSQKLGYLRDAKNSQIFSQEKPVIFMSAILGSLLGIFT